MSTDPHHSDEQCEPVRPSISAIGLVAYCALPPNLVFVRVPNERGRWLVTDRCVVDVPCKVCKAAVGEPCHNGRKGSNRRYHTSTHTDRRSDAKYRWRTHDRPPHKPHLSTNDIRDAQQEPA